MNESMDIMAIYKLNASRLILPKYSFTFGFETGRLKFYLNDIIIGHPNIAYIAGFLYLFSIFFIQWLMKEREPFRLKIASASWNAALLVINFVTFMRLFPHLWFMLRRDKFSVSLCSDWTFLYDEVCGTWLTLFPFLKMLELGDTFFIVLQKRYLDSYYWCHHLIALVGSWYLYPFYPAISLWLSLIITLSHIPIYLYALIRTLNFLKISTYVPFLLIFSEMITVLAGAILSVFIIYYQNIGENCRIDRVTAIILFVLFTSCCFLLCVLIIKKRKFIKNKLKSNA